MSKRSGIQLCYPFDENRLARWEPPFVVQPKLDGERCRAIFSGADNVGWRLVSSELNEFFSVPHINEALAKIGLQHLELDGELYRHGLPFYEIHSRVGRTVNLHSQSDEIQFHIFDIVDETLPQAKRLATLSRISAELSPVDLPVRVVPWELAQDLDDIMRYYDRFLNRGYEGIVVRNIGALYKRARSPFVMKFKPKKSDIYKIVDTIEEHDKNGIPKCALGALVCASDNETLFSVGSGLTRDQRYALWGQRSLLPGRYVRVEYQHTFPGGAPRFPVFIEVINENQILDPHASTR